jgi:uncharacterized protein (DUF486 family)
MRDAWTAAGLLLLSNTFMTTAWYGHLRYPSLPVWVAVLGSWGIALFEYVLQVPANRIGHHVLSAYQLKIMQEAITLVVFVAFSRLALGERLTPRHAASFALILAAVAIGFKS